MDFLGDIVALIAQIWQADSEIRNRSLLGESEFDRQCKRSVARLCGGAIVLLVLSGIAWWWFTRNK